jgi:hypothetical protein
MWAFGGVLTAIAAHDIPHQVWLTSRIALPTDGLAVRDDSLGSARLTAARGTRGRPKRPLFILPDRQGVLLRSLYVLHGAKVKSPNAQARQLRRRGPKHGSRSLREIRRRAGAGSVRRDLQRDGHTPMRESQEQRVDDRRVLASPRRALADPSTSPRRALANFLRPFDDDAPELIDV